MDLSYIDIKVSPYIDNSDMENVHVPAGMQPS